MEQLEELLAKEEDWDAKETPYANNQYCWKNSSLKKRIETILA